MLYLQKWDTVKFLAQVGIHFLLIVRHNVAPMLDSPTATQLGGGKDNHLCLSFASLPFLSFPFASLPFLSLPFLSFVSFFSLSLPSSPLPSPSPFLLPQTCLSLLLWRKIRLWKQSLCFYPGVVNPYLSWDGEVWRAVCITIPICVSDPSLRGAERPSTLEKGSLKLWLTC